VAASDASIPSPVLGWRISKPIDRETHNQPTGNRYDRSYCFIWCRSNCRRPCYANFCASAHDQQMQRQIQRRQSGRHAQRRDLAPGKHAKSAAASDSPVVASNAVFPSAVDSKYPTEKPDRARRKTYLDQYKANKTSNANGGLKWLQLQRQEAEGRGVNGLLRTKVEYRASCPALGSRLWRALV
jgi:hypothetical protein